MRHVEELLVYSILAERRTTQKKLGHLSLYPVLSIGKDTHVGPFCFAIFFYFVYFFGGLECAGHSFAYVAYFIFFYYSILFYSILFNLATHLPQLIATDLPILSHPSP